jgi:hypothetical protein
MPTYEWKNKRTGDYVQVQRPVSAYDNPPDDSGEWVRVITSPVSVPFQTLRDKGVFEHPLQTSTRRVNG